MPTWETHIRRQYTISGYIRLNPERVEELTDKEMLEYKPPPHPKVEDCKYYSVTVTFDPRCRQQVKGNWIGKMTNIELYDHFKQVLKTVRKRGYLGTFYPEYHEKGQRQGFLHFHGIIYTKNENDIHEKAAIQTSLTRRCGMIKIDPIKSEKQKEGWLEYIKKHSKDMYSKFNCLEV